MTFSFGLQISGRLDEAEALCVEMASLAAESRLTMLEWQLRSQLVGLRWHAGALTSAHDVAERLRSEGGGRVDGGRVDVDFYLSQILADLGRHGEARLLAARMVEQALPTWQGLGDALWALTDAELAAGRPRQALAAADRALAAFGDQGPTAFLQVSRAWAQHDLDVAPDKVTHVAGQPITEGAPPELDGISLLAQGSHREAAERFTAAARLWQGRHFRGMLRSTWAAGEALRRAGETAEAIARLAHAEEIALAHEHATLLARIRRSLRLVGQRRLSPRRKTGILTAREREVLELVGAGLSNMEIARRLGIGRPTVVGLIQSASRKLGARTRTQAAALAARE
jgi:DNA-binding CsgD family transcriptional regulator/tetratricopeptide (TPR) repeat protein